MKIWKYLTCLLAAAMLCPSYAFSYALLSVSAEDSFSETAYIAEKAQPSELTGEDRFVIVFGQEGLALSPFMQESRFAGLPVTEEGDGLTQISGNVAVFQIEKNDAGLMALRSDAGYLTSGKNGGSVYFSQKRTDRSLWESRGDFLCCPAAGTNGQTVCLEYYNGFTTYKMADGADPAPFTLSFFKLDDSFVPQHSEGGYRLPVFETSDIHGYMVDTSGDEYDYRLAFVADKVNDKETKIRIAASEFLCTTDRPDSGLHNPLVEWGATDRLISNDVTDIDGVTEVLRDEAAANDGYLAIDTKAHFINSAYTVPEDEKQDDAEVSGTSETAGNTTTVTQTTAAAAANTPSANTGSANVSAPKTADRSPLSVMFLLFAGMTAALSAFMLRKKKSSTDKRSLLMYQLNLEE